VGRRKGPVQVGVEIQRLHEEYNSAVADCRSRGIVEVTDNMDYFQMELPKVYWIRVQTHECPNCGNVFQRTVGDDLIVKFMEVGGSEERWLPTYGQGGYLDLLSKLVPGWSPEEQITMAVARQFDTAFQAVQEKSSRGHPFSMLFEDRGCPSCHGKRTQELSEVVLTSPAVTCDTDYRLTKRRLGCDAP
jgi:rubredoxin